MQEQDTWKAYLIEEQPRKGGQQWWKAQDFEAPAVSRYFADDIYVQSDASFLGTCAASDKGSSDDTLPFEQQVDGKAILMRGRKLIKRQRKHKELGSNRHETTIPKVIFTWLKKILVSRSCPVNMQPYFKICPYKENKRTLLDFQLVFWFAERVGGRDFIEFKSFLRNLKKVLLEEAHRVYFNRKRYKIFEVYLNRIYLAYFQGESSRERIDILYQSSPKKLKALQRLSELQVKLQAVLPSSL